MAPLISAIAANIHDPGARWGKRSTRITETECERSGEEQHRVARNQSTSGRQTGVQKGFYPPRFESVRDAAVETCEAGA